jgi:Lipase (class 3)
MQYVLSQDATDIITDITFAPVAFETAPLNSSDMMTNSTTSSSLTSLQVHSGFALAFESVREQIDEFMYEHTARSNSSTTNHTLLFTGHSMGGALAQLAAAYHYQYAPVLVTLATPATGNIAFCRHLDNTAIPHGGIRLWNEADVVPLLANLVGYRHAGVPVCRRIYPATVALYEQENINAQPLTIATNAVAPHVLYQNGAIVYAFPILGLELEQS